jgi:bifunctional DNA-binding transcriptional regulator/antitoxin component of YhaV-PrlF toxin-antitoxin module
MPARPSPPTSPTEPSRVDEQGRTIIPKEIRKALGIVGKAYVTYEVEGDSVRVRKVEWTLR